MDPPMPPKGCSDPSQHCLRPTPLAPKSISGVGGAVECQKDSRDFSLSDDELNDLAGLFTELSTKQMCLREFAEEQEAVLCELVGTFTRLGIVSQVHLQDARPEPETALRTLQSPEQEHAAELDRATPSPRQFLEGLAPLHDMEPKLSNSAKLEGKRHSVLDSIYSRALTHSESSMQTRFWERLAMCLQKVETLEEPPRTGLLASIVLGRHFISLTSFVILLNSVFIAISTDIEIQNLGKKPSDEVMTIELVLAGFYVVELALKLFVHRSYFFVNSDAAFNMFDFILVAFSAVENYVAVRIALNESDNDGHSFNLGFLRMLRICKIVKVLRIFRTLRFFKELRLMLDCVLGSVMNLLWCAVMIIFFLYMFSLVLVQGIAAFMLETNNVTSKDERALTLLKYFDCVGSTMITLFQAITGGVDWREPYTALLCTGPLLPALFVCFIALVSISVWNIVTGQYMERAMKLAQPDMDTLIMEKQIADYRDSHLLLDLFVRHLHLRNGESKVSIEDFHRLIEDPDFKAYLMARGIDIKNAQMFFKLLSGMEDGGEVDAITLANACVRMKGVATSIDLQLLSFESRLFVRQQLKAFSSIFEKISKVETTLAEDMTKRERQTLRSFGYRKEKISKPRELEQQDEVNSIQF
eukprot:TRINITY_DN106737_c0_g1_i1.p1 TRINITY_DN106737_c0_g1~~TRINITY_DN106737_c0_g1_i1.p1  ORF type:complete len:658 (+),score=112.29 TRINITY_DN106737_c0_g1_i1:51-1976(+)